MLLTYGHAQARQVLILKNRCITFTVCKSHIREHILNVIILRLYQKAWAAEKYKAITQTAELGTFPQDHGCEKPT